jgi:hypothetical protein
MDRLEYYRPRGAQGNYKAILKLQYMSSETIEVVYYRANRERSYDDHTPFTVDAVREGDVITFDLPPLKVGDGVLIRIRDRDVALPQITFYEVEKGGLRQFIPSDPYKFCRYRDGVLHDEEERNWATVRKTQFKPIELVDMDGKSKRWPSLF